jgi:hypothetical protein
MMKIFISLLVLQSLVIFVWGQAVTKYSAGDSITKIIQQLPEYRAEQKRVDSIRRYNTKSFAQFGVGVTVAVTERNKIARVVITDDLDTEHLVAYLIEYDLELKKVISIKKQY